MAFTVDAAGTISSVDNDFNKQEGNTHGAERRELLKMVDRRLVYAAWLIFNSRVKPNDLNELLEHKDWIFQVLQDSPQLLPLIYNAVFMEYLHAYPEKSLVARFKDLMQSKSPKEDTFDLFERETEARPLTDAGWKLLLKQPIKFQRQWAGKYWGLAELAYVLNVFSEFQITELDPIRVALVTRLRFRHIPLHTLKTVFAALRDATTDTADLDKQADLVAEWVTSTHPELPPRIKWTSLVALAVAYAHAKDQAEALALENLSWTSPVKEPFDVGSWKVTPLTTGQALAQEGIQMKNCLDTKFVRNYVQAGLLGQSLVFSVRSSAVWVTVEFARKATQDKWTLTQCEGPNGEIMLSQPELQPVFAAVTSMLNP